MIASCKQMTYSDAELLTEHNNELSRTLSAIKQIRDELIGNYWPYVLDAQRQKIVDELVRREAEGIFI